MIAIKMIQYSGGALISDIKCNKPVFRVMGSNFIIRSFYQLMTSFTTFLLSLFRCFRFSRQLNYACPIPSKKRNKRRHYSPSVQLFSQAANSKATLQLANQKILSALLLASKNKALLSEEFQAMACHNWKMAELQEEFLQKSLVQFEMTSAVPCQLFFLTSQL